LIVVTTPEIAGMKTVKTIGMVQANRSLIVGDTLSFSSVRDLHAGRDIMASLRNLVGGEIGEYTKLLADSREMAIARMTERAEQMGANAVLSTRFITAGIMGGAAEILIYGTAAVVEPD
jgi:uncharacterized protein YbjQ (UPF0145 family)